MNSNKDNVFNVFKQHFSLPHKNYRVNMEGHFAAVTRHFN